jgi:hypothetical protein
MVGAHIRALKDGRWVHAIDCGDETVLHLAEDAAPRRVRRAYRPEFVAGAESVELVTHRERTFPPKEVVRRAYSRAADPTLATMFGDSQAFAQWCTTGRLSGEQNVALNVSTFAPAAPAAPSRSNGVTRAAKPPSKPAPAPRAKAKVKVKARAKPAAKAQKARPARATKRKAPASKTAAGARKGVRAAKPPARAQQAARRGARPTKRKGGRR